MASNIAKAATAAGLPATSIEQFVPAIIGQNKTGLATIPGATPSIIGVGVDALLNTYVTGFRNVWASAIAFIVLAAIGEYNLCMLTTCLLIGRTASLFLIDPRKEFNNHIDAPVEKDQDMYSS